VPGQQGVRRDQRGDALQRLPTDGFRLGCQPAALIVREDQPAAAEFFLENLVFGTQVVDDLLLVAVEVASQADQQELLRLVNDDQGRFPAVYVREGPAGTLLGKIVCLGGEAEAGVKLAELEMGSAAWERGQET
jgi:hypothetical protein